MLSGAPTSLPIYHYTHFHSLDVAAAADRDEPLSLAPPCARRRFWTVRCGNYNGDTDAARQPGRATFLGAARTLATLLLPAGCHSLSPHSYHAVRASFTITSRRGLLHRSWTRYYRCAYALFLAKTLRHLLAAKKHTTTSTPRFHWHTGHAATPVVWVSYCCAGLIANYLPPANRYRAFASALYPDMGHGTSAPPRHLRHLYIHAPPLVWRTQQ